MTVIDVLLYIVVSWEMLFPNGGVMGEDGRKKESRVFRWNLLVVKWVISEENFGFSTEM